VEQGLGQLSNLLNSKLFLTKVLPHPAGSPHYVLPLTRLAWPFSFPLFLTLPFISSPRPQFIHTLESQRTFSARDRAYVASLLTVALHGKLEYFTDILRTLLSDLVAQYVAKNPKLMLRRSV
jgi:plexin B